MNRRVYLSAGDMPKEWYNILSDLGGTAGMTPLYGRLPDHEPTEDELEEGFKSIPAL